MSRLRRTSRAIVLIAGVAIVAACTQAIAAAPSGEPPGQAKQEKREKGPEVATTLTGTVQQTTDEKGRPTFSISVDGTVWELSSGPKWFWGENNPLAAWVGQTVEVTGTYREGAAENELDVETVNGERLRAEGRPPWAGGPKEVGESHPGWKDWKADGKPGNGHGREDAPGQNKAPPSDDPG